MKGTVFIVAALSLMLAACPRPGAVPDPKNPQVTIKDGVIAVDQQEIRFTKDQQNVTITWRLPKDDRFRFPRNGIVVQKAGEEIVDCAPSSSALEFSCLNRNTRPERYKYDINVLDGDKPLKPLDPFIVNQL